MEFMNCKLIIEPQFQQFWKSQGRLLNPATKYWAHGLLYRASLTYHNLFNLQAKMALEVELISRETIKPSSSTPPHLKTLKLCLLDQLMTWAPIPFLVSYSPNPDQNNQDKLNRLKKSLSNVLTEFYPLAGQISDNLTIDCNDQGVNFFHTRVTGQLSDQVVSSPIPDELVKLLPEDNFAGVEPRVLLSIQANVFECGGIAVGVCMSHKIGDASSLSFFLDTWAAIARGESTGIVSPKFDMTSLFPPMDIPSDASAQLPHEKVVTKRFLFSASNIAALRAKCAEVESPTRVEAISALIWRCALNVASPTSAAVHAVDVRRRMAPPLSNTCFGSLVTYAMATTTPESSLELPCLVGQLRKAIRKIDSEYVKNLQDGDRIFEFLAYFMKIEDLFQKGETELYIFTSWCRLRFYEADFGWGKPVQANPAKFPVKNLIVLVDTKSDNGIEAWISLCEADMARFECEPELIGFTTNDQMI